MKIDNWARATGAATALAAALSSCGGGGGSAPSAGSFSFAAGPGFSVSESGAAINQAVVRRIGGSFGAVTVAVTPVGMTATPGSSPLAPPADFDATPIVVSFADGDAADKLVSVPIFDDGIVEGPETLSLVLSSPTGGAKLGAFASATLTIVDDDAFGSLEFSGSAFAVGEDGVATTPIVVRRVGGRAGVVSADVSFTSGTANADPDSLVEPVDFVSTTQTIVFGDGDDADKVVAPPSIVQDLLPELDETILLALSNPTGGATIGAASTATTTIVDDDVSAILPPPTNIAGSRYGASVAAALGRIAIGRPAAANNAGTVRILDAATGATIRILGPPATTTLANFGSSLALAGSHLVIGSPDSPGINNTGGATVMNPLDGSIRHNINLFPSNGGFGSAVAYQSGRIFVGAPTHTGPNGGGIFVYDELNGELIGNLPTFGVNVGTALASWGGKVYAGAPGMFSGFAGGYDASTLAAAELIIPNPFPGGTIERFGQAVAVTASHLFVGATDDVAGGNTAGRVYAFDRATGALLATIDAPAPSIANGKFGARIALVRDRLVVQQQLGGVSASGRVFVFDPAFNHIQTIDQPSPVAAADFGAALAEFDGALIVGAPGTTVSGQPNAGNAYVFKIN